jgi:hypothetical protein
MPHHHELIMSDETATQPRIKVKWLFATLAAFAIFLVIGAYSKRMTNDYPSYDSQRALIRYQYLATVQAAENVLIYPVDAQGKSTAEWVDEKKGTVRIPIDEAMAHEVDDLKARTPAMGNALPSTAPAPAPAPAPGAAPAAAPAAGAPATPPATPAATPDAKTPDANKKPAPAKPAAPAPSAQKPSAPPANPNH